MKSRSSLLLVVSVCLLAAWWWSPYLTLRWKLFSALQARRKDIGDKPAKVRLECGDNLSYKLLIKLMDEITRAGFRQVAPALQDDRKKK